MTKKSKKEKGKTHSPVEREEKNSYPKQKESVPSSKEQEKKWEHSQQELEQLKEEKKQLIRKVEELQKEADKNLRAYAKCENEKRLLKKEVETQIEYAYERFAKDLLPVVDSLELALHHAQGIENREEGFNKLVEGVELTLKQMLNVFKNHQIEPVHHGEFDPNFHQAVQQVESDNHKDGAIVDIYQKGYTFKGRLIRPSIVTINKKNK